MPSTLDAALKLTLYPRGFLGRVAKAEIRPKVKTFGRSGSAKQFELYQPAQNELLPDLELMRLYKKWFEADPFTTSFNYRREVLSLATQIFGTDNFYAWYLVQQASPAYGDWHKRFLEDTVRYIAGEKRTLPMRTWQRLVTYQDGPADPKDCPIVANYFGKHAAPKGAGNVVESIVQLEDNAALVTSLQNWLMKPLGLDDLLNTLYLLFGDVN